MKFNGSKHVQIMQLFKIIGKVVCCNVNYNIMDQISTNKVVY